MALSVPATVAEDVAAGFRRFRDHVPEHATAITIIIADLYTISSSLKSLEDLSRHRHYGTVFNVARSDVELVSASLQYTLDDIVEFFGRLEGRKGSSRTAHQRTWETMTRFFLDESDETLTNRLIKYKFFMKELEELIKECVLSH